MATLNNFELIDSCRPTLNGEVKYIRLLIQQVDNTKFGEFASAECQDKPAIVFESQEKRDTALRFLELCDLEPRDIVFDKREDIEIFWKEFLEEMKWFVQNDQEGYVCDFMDCEAFCVSHEPEWLFRPKEFIYILMSFALMKTMSKGVKFKYMSERFPKDAMPDREEIEETL